MYRGIVIYRENCLLLAVNSVACSGRILILSCSVCQLISFMTNHGSGAIGKCPDVPEWPKLEEVLRKAMEGEE